MSEFTVKQIAEALEVSKPTVQKLINKNSIQPVRIAKNKYRYYSLEDAAEIAKKINPSFNVSVLESVSEKPQTETAKPENQIEKLETETAKPETETAKLETETAKPQNSDELELLKRTVAIIEKQLEEKDKQIKDLSDRLAEALQLTKGQQYITAADKTTELLEADNRRNVEEADSVIEPEPAAPADSTEKKGFWRRIFGF